jgi:Domain of unknown function (DUF1648)
VPGVIVFGVMAMMTAYAWVRTPPGAQIPLQWGASGKPTNFAGKAEALLSLPILMLILAPLLDAVPFLPYGNKSGGLYHGAWNLFAWYGLLVLFPVAQFITIVAASRTWQ